MIRSATSFPTNFLAFCRARPERERFAKRFIVVEDTDETLFWMEIELQRLHRGWFSSWYCIPKSIPFNFLQTTQKFRWSHYRYFRCFKIFSVSGNYYVTISFHSTVILKRIIKIPEFRCKPLVDYFISQVGGFSNHFKLSDFFFNYLIVFESGKQIIYGCKCFYTSKINIFIRIIQSFYHIGPILVPKSSSILPQKGNALKQQVNEL